MSDRWYLIRTKVSLEALAQRHLERQNYQTYCPRLVSKKRVFGKRIQVVTPLFPQYLFLNLTVGEQDLGPVKSTKGVLNVVRFGQDYAIVPKSVIACLKTMEDPRIQLRVGQTVRFISQSLVRVVRGPFYGCRATFLQESGEHRVLILMNILGQQTTVTIDESFVEACA